MKQIIVMITMVALGIFIGAMVLGFQSDVQLMGDETKDSLLKINNRIEAAYTSGSAL